MSCKTFMRAYRASPDLKFRFAFPKGVFNPGKLKIGPVILIGRLRSGRTYMDAIDSETRNAIEIPLCYMLNSKAVYYSFDGGEKWGAWPRIYRYLTPIPKYDGKYSLRHVEKMLDVDFRRLFEWQRKGYISMPYVKGRTALYSDADLEEIKDHISRTGYKGYNKGNVRRKGGE